MNPNKFTIKAQEAIQEAISRVQRQGQQTIEPEHLLAGILKVGEQVTQFVFRKMGISPTVIQQAVDARINTLPHVQGGEPYPGRELSDILNRAEDIAQKQGDEFVSIEPLLQAILASNTAASKILKDAGMTESELRKAIQE
ncbi:MAG: type VI secretion system ATPase TssH, partial [Bacteroidaceae bacterium]|nr:type VI secretion system ATPase TssH [Bacteroidaceae bacterium]